MRDPKRIDAILKCLEFWWKTNPDLRLGQIICCTPKVASGEVDPFYLEDEDLYAALTKDLPALAELAQSQPPAQRRRGFPAAVFIDDKCDACDATQVRGVSYGANKPVICWECHVRAAEIFPCPPEVK
jgi:hypothetical protein